MEHAWNESCKNYERTHETCMKRVMRHTWNETGHISRERWDRYEMWEMSHGIYMTWNESWDLHEMSHGTSMCYATNMTWVIRHTWNESWDIYESWDICEMSHCINLFDIVIALHFWYENDSVLCVTWLIYTSDMAPKWKKMMFSFLMCDMTQSYDMTHLHVWHGLLIKASWCIHVCDMTHSCVWHASIIRVSTSNTGAMPIVHLRFYFFILIFFTDTQFVFSSVYLFSQT